MNKWDVKRIVIAIVSLILFVALSGLLWNFVKTSKAQNEKANSWMRIQNGYPQDSVLAWLGNPQRVHGGTKLFGGATYEVWHYGEYSYVEFDSVRRVVEWRQ